MLVGMRRYGGIGILLVCGAAALVYESRRTGLTVDETAHFATAYTWWLGEDVLQPADAPPLTRMICGWVPRLLHAPSPHDTAGWKDRDAYVIGAEILDRTDIRARRLLFYTRLPFLAFPLLIVWLLWLWGRQLFGEAIGLYLAVCGVLEPTMAGHGVLIDSDVPAAFGALWFGYAAWRYWNSPDWRRVALLTAATMVAVLTKFTLLPLAIVAIGLVLVRGPRAGAMVLPAAVYAAIVAASQFQVWPAQFVHGLEYVSGSLRGKGFTGYLWGHQIEGWVPLYFPLCWAIKFPIPLQVLTVAGAVAALGGWTRKSGATVMFVWAPAVFFFGTATASNYHIGFRHVLPAVPFFILGGGFALARWKNRAIPSILVVWLAASALHAYPHGIAYFNEWIGGPSPGWRYLADSNIDWGQGLPELGTYVQRHRIARIRTFLFGYDNPFFYLKPGSMDPQPLPSPGESTLPRRYLPGPGTYAVSVNFLTGYLCPPGYEDYLANFRGRRPDGSAGYSILIYEWK